MDLTTSLWILAAAVAFGLWVSINHLQRSRKGEKRVPERPFPNEWRHILREKIAFYNRLNSIDRQEFERKVHIFLLNVQITGVDTEVTHQDRILIASGAVIPIFRFKNWHYANLKEVQVHPDKFQIPTTDKWAHGLVGWGEMEGKMMLSRKAVEEGFYDQSDNKNVAIHEFIHILDKQDGTMDGVLNQVMNEIDIMPWLTIINRKMNEIDLGDSSIRDYGATNEAEFLAAVSEYFFENPDKMRTEHPALYNALDSFFNGRSEEVSRRKFF